MVSSSALSPLHVDSTGSGEPEVILVHGFGAYGHFWRKWVPMLTEQHRTHSVDLMGFGRAATPSGGDYSPDAQAHHLAQFMRRVLVRTELPPVLIGHSLGAGIALLASLVLKDQKLEVPLSGLVLISGAVYAQRLPRYISLVRNPFAGGVFLLAAPPRSLLRKGIRSLVSDPDVVDDELVNGYRDPLGSFRRRRAVLRAARQLDPARAGTLESRLREVSIPTLVIWGEEDPVIPVEHGHRLVRDLPRARLHTLPGVGHLPPEEAPLRSVEPVLELLSSLRPGSDDPDPTRTAPAPG